jgi:hypothetical protein
MTSQEAIVFGILEVTIYFLRFSRVPKYTESKYPNYLLACGGPHLYSLPRVRRRVWFSPTCARQEILVHRLFRLDACNGC